jgi:periplasmic copper chaperone A
MRITGLPALLLTIGLVTSSVGVATADELKLGDLTISGLWTRATPPKAPSAGGYLTIANAGKDADRLVEVSSRVAGKAELHEMAMKKGVMTMRPVEGGVPIPPGGKVDLTPDGLHIMFTELKQSLKPGDKVPVTLTFEKAGKTDTVLTVLPIGSKGPKGAPAPKNDMGGMKM